MKYKVGDQVKIRKDINSNDNYYMEFDEEYYNYATENMVISAEVNDYIGTIAIVSDIGYFLDMSIGDSFGVWTDEMFEGVVE